MRRRRLLSLLLLSAFARSAPLRAQVKRARVGVLTIDTPGVPGDVGGDITGPLREVLRRYGWEEQRNLALDIRRPSGAPPDYASIAAQFAAANVDVICSISAPATRAVQKATRSIPIVALDFTNDPVAAGYAQSYGRPGGNITGVFLDAPQFSAKWLELLKEVVPRLTKVAVLWDPSPGPAHLDALRKAAQASGISLHVVAARSTAELEQAFKHFGKGVQALIVLPSPMTWGHSGRLAQLALEHRLVATSAASFFAEVGGAFTYGPDVPASLERVAMLVAKVLAGARPGDLPVERPASFKLVVNRRTLESLGYRIPESIAISAERIIP
jgi:putative ABC transport system substrate-binding protein